MSDANAQEVSTEKEVAPQKTPSKQKAQGSKWTLAKAIKRARKFKTQEAWEKGAQASFKAATHWGWIKECTAHMEKSKTASAAKTTSSNVVKLNAKKKKVAKKTKKKSVAKVATKKSA